MLDEATRDRARGALLGLAVGDALGTTLEFSRRDSQPLQMEITGGGPFGLQPGQWTDDTSMALALADSLIQSGGLDPRDLAERFVAWWKQGAFSATGHCFDIGVTTAEALGRFRANGNPMAGSTDENAAGNGSVMRLAPVVLATLGHPLRRTEWAAGQSRVTHGSPQAVEGCVWFAELLARAIGGEPKEQLLAPDRGGDHPALRALHRAEWATRGTRPDPLQRLCGAHAGSRALVGVPHRQLRGCADPGGESGRGFRHGRGGDGPARGGAVWTVRNPRTLAGAAVLAKRDHPLRRCAAGDERRLKKPFPGQACIWIGCFRSRASATRNTTSPPAARSAPTQPGDDQP